MNKRRKGLDIMVVGFALFAMFFGAGNLIFPPALGLMTGNQWLVGFIFYFIADIGLAAVTVLAMTNSDGKAELITAPLGKIPSRIIITAIILCIGPGFAIPRTAATTFELGVLPVFEIQTNKVLLAIFSVVFFVIVLLLSIMPSKVVDIIGKILTPVLLICITIMIIKGIITPPSVPGPVLTDSVAKEGIYNGYQTMDMLAGLAFTAIIIGSFKDKGYTDKSEVKSLTLYSTLLSAFLLLLIYGGLTYLGATCLPALRKEMLNGSINQASLLIAIIQQLLGNAGLIIIAIVVAFACLTTAIGLTSSAAEYFASITKLSYSKLVVIICVLSAFICNLGLSQIISISGPILQLLYPLAVLMVFTSFLKDKVTCNLPYQLAAIVTLIESIIETAGSVFGIQACIDFVAKLPLASYGFGWLIPAVVVFIITWAVTRGKNK